MTEEFIYAIKPYVLMVGGGIAAAYGPNSVAAGLGVVLVILGIQIFGMRRMNR